jgi:hypothetical protein
MTDRESAARLFRSARREARVVLVVFALALTWTVGYCYLRGYQHPPDGWAVRWGLAESGDAANFQTLAGMPEWVWLGILLPWLLCSAFTAGFCVGMTDDDLGAEADGGASRGH